LLGSARPVAWKIQLAITDFDASRCTLSCANRFDLLPIQNLKRER
jgi:hypothetical protein